MTYPAQAPTLVDPRLVKARAGDRGSGWAIGTIGVLTARHIIAPFLAGEVDYCAAVLDPNLGAVTYQCDVVWQDELRDLALLKVGDKQASDWLSRLSGTDLPVLS